MTKRTHTMTQTVKPSHRALPFEFRNMIIQRRKDLGITLKELGKRVGVSDALLNHFEMGRRYPSPATLLRVLAELKFGPDEFGIVLEHAPESWMARRLASLTSREAAIALRDGRKAAKLDIPTAAALANLSPELLMAFEEGKAIPSRALLATIVGTWNLSRANLLKLSKGGDIPGNFAAEFVGALLEQSGFVVSATANGFINAPVGGGWSLNINVSIKHESEQ